MLLDRGTFEGRRYLRRDTVALMTSDHIGSETHIARDYFYFPGSDSGFSFGFAVRTAQPGTRLPDRRIPLGWRCRHVFFIDPRDDMFVICMMQTPTQRERIQTELKMLVYDALEK